MARLSALPAPAADVDIVWMSPAEVCAMLPGLTEESLTQRRKRRQEPDFYKPTGAGGNVVLYDRADVIAWVRKSRVSTTPEWVAS